MSTASPKDYYDQKKGFLDQLVTTSEELLNHIDNLDLFHGILNQRQILIDQFAEFEACFKQVFESSLSAPQKEELNSTLHLVNALDKKTGDLMEEEKSKISLLIKANVNEQKFIKYNTAGAVQAPNLLDFKK